MRKIFKTSFPEVSNARCRHRFSVDLTDLWSWPARFQKQSVFDLSGCGLDTSAALEIIDSFGQKSLLRFSGFAANAPVNAEAFRFKVPPGADVIEQ